MTVKGGNLAHKKGQPLVQRYIGVDVKEAIAQNARDLENASRDRTQCQDAGRQAKQQHSRATKAIRDVERRLEKYRQEERRLTQQVQRLKDTQNEGTELDTAELEEESQQIQERIDYIQGTEMEEHSQMMEEAQAKIAPLVEEDRRAEEELAKAMLEVTMVQEKVGEHLEAYQKAKMDAKKVRAAEAAQKEKVKGLRKAESDCANDLASATAKAVKFCGSDERVDIPEGLTLEALEGTLNGLTKKLVREEKRNKVQNGDELEAKMEAKKKKYEKESREYRAIKKNRKRCKTILIERTKKFRRWRKVMARVTSTVFNSNLNRNGYAGRVHFEHGDQALHFKVVVDQESSNQRKVKDTKSLSGGERSYTTLALLLAVGASVQSPFRCMDEFDIFMDEKHRKVTLETLHAEAKTPENINKQYIFITPNDLSSVTPVDGEVEIKQMKPPARGVGGDSD